MENLSRVFQKQKRKKTYKEIEFLLLFTSCRKVLGKMPANNPGIQVQLKRTLKSYLVIKIHKKSTGSA